MDNFHKIKQIINTIFENNELEIPKEISFNSSLKRDLEMDSIMMAEMSVRLEDEFGIDVFENGLLFSIEEILEKVTNQKQN